MVAPGFRMINAQVSSPLILAGIRVNGEIIYTTVADANAVIEIGNTRLTLLPAPQDFDGGVEIGTLDKGEQIAEKEKRGAKKVDGAWQTHPEIEAALKLQSPPPGDKPTPA